MFARQVYTLSLLVSLSLQVDIFVEKNTETYIVSPDYSEVVPPGTNRIWNIKTTKDAKLVINCDDIVMSRTDGCEDGYLRINDGIKDQKYCNSMPSVIVMSVGNEMQFELNLKTISAVTHCHVASVPIVDTSIIQSRSTAFPQPDNEIYLDLNGPSYDKIYYDNFPKGTSKIWNFVTSPDAKISMYCDRVLFGYSPDEGYLSVKGGEKEVKMIGHRINVNVDRSVANKFTVEARAITRDGIANCLVQAVNGSDVHQFKNLASQEIDSSEFGVTEGIKRTTCECGQSTKSKARISGGNEVTEGEFPWIVSILYKERQWCGGSIITKHHVLSAAHCFGRRRLSDFKIITGSRHFKNTEQGQILGIKNKTLHDYVQCESHLNDVAVLLLDQEIKFSGFVGPICLTNSVPELTHKYVTILGWGYIGDPEYVGKSQTLLKANTRVINKNTCSYLWLRRLSQEQNRLCVWSSRKSTCHGDSGGPVAWLDPETNRYTQVGIVSFGNAGCNFERPAVNTDVAFYYDWIQKAIADLKPASTCKKID